MIVIITIITISTMLSHKEVSKHSQRCCTDIEQKDAPEISSIESFWCFDVENYAIVWQQTFQQIMTFNINFA